MPNSIFRKVPIQVQNRSGFNCSHSNTFTAKCGTLMPVLVDPLLPNTDVDLDVACEVQLPPSVSDFYGSIEARLEMFFVPYRILWAGWQWFMISQHNMQDTPANNYSVNVKNLPQMTAPSQLTGAGTLADMLGFKKAGSTSNVIINNPLPFLAYQMVWDKWYRDSRITAPIFVPNIAISDMFNWKNAPYNVGLSSASQSNPGTILPFTLGVAELCQLRQRCWDRDYFTNATLEPQSGASVKLEFTGVGTPAVDDTTLVNSSFTIASLRAANSLQQFAERNQLAGQRYADQIFARFGCYPADAITDRPIYLGSKRFNIYKRNVYQQAYQPEEYQQNPFSGLLANKSTSLGGFGDGRLGSFKATEHGFIFVMFSLVPQAVYSTGCRRYLNYSKLTDFPDPLLQGVGDQPIYDGELTGLNGANMTNIASIFGYTQRFAEAKFMQDEVHGLLRDGQSLSAFQLQRTFTENQELGTSFLEIPQNYLDQVTYADGSVSEFGCWCQCYFNYRKVQPLAAYSLPTLGDPKDTHTEVINNGGTRL